MPYGPGTYDKPGRPEKSKKKSKKDLLKDIAKKQ